MRLAIVAVALLLTAPAAAQDVIVEPGEVWTVFTTVEADVRDNYATVQVIADIGNRGPDPEFPFLVSVPDDAFITGLTIERDGEVHVAAIAPRDQAREVYEEHKSNEMTGGLVEKQRGSQTFAFLVNVAAQESVRATLTYEQYLRADAGVYALPLEAPVSGFGQDLGAAFHVRIDHADGVTSAWSDPASTASRDGSAWVLSHEVGPRPDDAGTPLVAYYSLGPSPAGGTILAARHDGDIYFAHRFEAPPDDVQIPVDLVMVLDTSGSMSGQKMQQMQDAAIQVVQTLGADDRLHLVLFASDVRQPWSGLAAADAARRADAIDAIRDAVAAGSTALGPALEAGMEAFEPYEAGLLDQLLGGGPNMPILVALTDGRPTSGQSDPDVIRETTAEANDVGARVFGIAFGGAADWPLMAGLAKDGRGLAMQVAEGAGAEVDLRRFMGALTKPVLNDVVIEYPQGTNAFHTEMPVLFAGTEMLVAGTTPAARIEGDVTGQAHDGQRTYDFQGDLAGDAPHLPRLVAFQQIDHLQRRIAAEGERQAWVDEVTRLGLLWGFVTDYTSLVVTLPAAPVATDDRALMAASESSDTAAASGRGDSDGAWLRDWADRQEDKEASGVGAVLLLGTLALAVVGRRRT